MKRILALLLLAACAAEEQPATTKTAAPTAPPPPTQQQARELIANAPELSEHQFTNAGWTAAVARSLRSEPIQAEARQFADRGWIAFDGSGNIVLTDKSRSDKRFLMRANGILDVVPLAKKEMGDVTAVRTNPDGSAAADFTWKWVPNEVGTAFRSGTVHDRYAAPQKSTATLMWDGSSWIILKME